MVAFNARQDQQNPGNDNQPAHKQHHGSICQSVSSPSTTIVSSCLGDLELNYNSLRTITSSRCNKTHAFMLQPVLLLMIMTIAMTVAQSTESSVPPLRVFGPVDDNHDNGDDSKNSPEVSFAWYTTAQQRQFLQDHGSDCWPTVAADNENNNNNNALLQRFDEFSNAPFLQVELWKFCVFATTKGNVFWDRSQVVPLLTWEDLWQTTSTDQTTALLVAPSTTTIPNGATHTLFSTKSWIHSSFLRLDSQYAPSLSRTMMRLLLETERAVLTSNPLYMYQALAQQLQNEYDDEDNNNSNTSIGKSSTRSNSLWKVHCHVPSPTNPVDRVLVEQPRKQRRRRQKAGHQDANSALDLAEFSHLPTFGLHCTIPGGYCCQVWNDDGDDDDYMEDSSNEDGSKQKQQQHTSPPILMIKHPFGTSGGISTTATTKSTTMDTKTAALQKQQYPLHKDPVPYWSTVTAVPTSTTATPKKSKLESPNFFDILLQNNCLPTSTACHACLKRYTHSTGCDEQCTLECPCYCKVLCQIRPPPKQVQAVWYVAPPLLQLPEKQTQPQRLIPRIVHQTWYEPLEPDKYPNMSRLQQSWKQSGWTHKFYDDATAAVFLQDHFPPQVLEAYHAIQPGAFKADLFRYCVLLIQGGVYADMDVLLETNLEEAIAPNVGFMTPMDEPGIKVGQQSCLWNGFMAVAPGHPFVAKTIELVVNNIRNRFTSVDYDDMLCPNPILSTAHLFDILFTTGPCILGTAMNLVLQRPAQTGFTPGEIDVWGIGGDNGGADGLSGGSGDAPPLRVEPNDPRLAIPGRSIILRQNKNDMGAHRFTLEERNIVVCSTDMPDYDDRPKKPHYAESGKQTALYGTAQLYSDFVSANEEIRVVVVGNSANYTL